MVTFRSEWDDYPNERAMWGAKAWATTKLSHFSWYIPIPATIGFFVKNFCFTFKVNASAVWQYFALSLILDLYSFHKHHLMSSKLAMWSVPSLNYARHLMAYTVNNQHIFKSEILAKWITNIFYSQFTLFVCDLPVYKLWTTARWQWSTFDSRVKCSSIEPKEISTRWWSNMY